MATYTLSPFFAHRVSTQRLDAEVQALLPARYRLVQFGSNDSFSVVDPNSTGSFGRLLSFTGGSVFAGDRYRFTANGDRFVVEGFSFDEDGLPEQELRALLAVLCMMCTLQHTIENPKAAAPTQRDEPTQGFVDRALAVFGLKRI